MEWYDARVDPFFHAPENGVSLGCLSTLQPCPWWRPGQTLCQWHHATLPLLPRFLGQVGLPQSDHRTSAKKMSVSLHFAIPIKVFPSRDIEPLSLLFWGIERVTFSLIFRSFTWNQPCNNQNSAVTTLVDIQNALCKATVTQWFRDAYD